MFPHNYTQQEASLSCTCHTVTVVSPDEVNNIDPLMEKAKLQYLTFRQ